METANKLSPEQIENWRRVLFGMIGPYAIIMPDYEIQRYKDNLQAKLNSLDENEIEPDFKPKPMTAMELAFAKVKK